jgi:hypothetical protein
MNIIKTALSIFLLGLALASCTPAALPPAQLAVPVNPVSPAAQQASATPADQAPASVLLFDGRMLDGKETMPGPSLAELPTVEAEVKSRLGDPKLESLLMGETALTQENFQARLSVEGSFTRPGAKQKALFYRLGLGNGLVIVEDDKVVAHYAGSPGDYALYTYLVPVDANADGLTDLLLYRNVEDNEDIYAYLFLMEASGPRFSGATTVFSSNVLAGEENPPERLEATAYLAKVLPGGTPTFSRETYHRKGREEWSLLQADAPFRLENSYAPGDEPKLVPLGSSNAAVDRIEAAIRNLDSYVDVPSSIDFANPRNDAERLVAGDPELRRMELLDTRAAVYAVENATKQEVDRKDATKYALSLEGMKTSEEIRLAYMKHTTESLGGESPYARR